MVLYCLTNQLDYIIHNLNNFFSYLPQLYCLRCICQLSNLTQGKASSLIVVQRAQCLDAKPGGNDASHHVEDRHEHIQNEADVRVVKGNANT